MPKFSNISKQRLETCHADLKEIFYFVVKRYDCSILEGERNEETQNLLYYNKKSKLKYPNSKHNRIPSEAVDVAPYPVDFSDDFKTYARFYHFAGYVLAVALFKGIKLRWGGDWDSDKEFSDQSFDDLVHFELVGNYNIVETKVNNLPKINKAKELRRSKAYLKTRKDITDFNEINGFNDDIIWE